MWSVPKAFVLFSTLLRSSLVSGVDNHSIVYRQNSSGPVPPSEDPFYTAPQDFELASPGTILRIRHDPGNLTAVVANTSAVYNIIYRTTDTRYRPSWAVTTLLVPKTPLETRYPTGNTTAQGQGALLSYQIPYNSADVNSSPSYRLGTDYATPSTVGPPATDGIAKALGRGWYVSVPDFEGPLAAFFAGSQEGHAVLDSVRAVLSWDGFPSSSEEARYALWGYSGGSVASHWAAELQASYAPELAFAGAALGGTVPNATSAYDNITATPYSGLLPGMLLGITAEYPEARDFLVSSLHTEGPYNATGFLAALQMTVGDEFVVYAGQDINRYFIQGRDFLRTPEIARILGNNGYQGYHGIPQMPVFVYKAIGDEFSNVADTDALVERFCGVGANILYQRNTVGGHIDEISNGEPRAMDWLVEVLEGATERKQPATGCVVENVTVNVTASTT
ncbi:hypothetical protein SLS62_006220 [Diatrype stigma]|uniref:LIP-domain-containing protein n=1 Tax=Diatrype stigma TaxID=117547 RepID=A0AAN9UZ52_9PEZI